MKSFKSIFGGDVRQFTMLGALVALILFFQIGTGGKVLTSTNMVNLINGNSYVLILAIGMVMVIVIGHIDLSVGSVAAVVGIIVALAIRDWGIPWWVGILLGLAVGAAIGAWNGWWVAYVGIPGFITTLAGMMLFRGLNQYIGHSNSIPVPKEFQTSARATCGSGAPTRASTTRRSCSASSRRPTSCGTSGSCARRPLRIGMQPATPVVASVRAGLLIVVIGYVTFLFGAAESERRSPCRASCSLRS